MVLKYHAYRYAPSKRQWSTAPQKAQQYILMLSVANARNGIVLREYELEHLEEARLTATTLAVVLGVDVQEFTPDRTPDNSLLISE